MKCMTCYECSDKGYCAILNGLKEAPTPLIAYKIKGCYELYLEKINKIKESVETKKED